VSIRGDFRLKRLELMKTPSLLGTNGTRLVRNIKHKMTQIGQEEVYYLLLMFGIRVRTVVLAYWQQSILDCYYRAKDRLNLCK
jgi:hypothetical protein